MSDANTELRPDYQARLDRGYRGVIRRGPIEVIWKCSDRHRTLGGARDCAKRFMMTGEFVQLSVRSSRAKE